MRLVGGLTEDQRQTLDNDLFEFTRMGSVNGVKRSILLGADVNALDPRSEVWKLPQDRSYYTPLMHAISRGFVDVVNELIKYGADVNKRLSPKLGSLERSIHENEYHYQTGPGMYYGLKYPTPLMMAIEREVEFHDTANNIKIIRALLNHGARIGDSMLGRVTALDLAVEYHLWDCADVLIKYDPSPEGRDAEDIDNLLRRIAHWKKYGT